MWNDIRDIYRSAWAFAFVCPLLFLIPVLVELAQHIVEWQSGMYDGLAAAKAAENDSLRMQFGFAKTIALTLPGYWFIRYILFGNSAAHARQIVWPAIGLWLVLFAIQTLQSWWALFGPDFTHFIGLTGDVAKWTGYAFMAITSILGFYFTAWFAAWPLGNAAIGPIRSVRIMHGHFWWAVLLLIAGVLPLMVLHYALGFGAIFGPALLDWPLLILDSIVVGFLALTMAGSIAIAARRAASAKQVSLTP